jgi:biopolymer transport protein ExbD
VAVGADGNYSVNHSALPGRSLESLAAALTEAAKGGKDTVVVISADANARHQSVVTVMEAARRAGLNQITFATQSSAQAGVK